jgi:hypothetical protein
MNRYVTLACALLAGVSGRAQGYRDLPNPSADLVNFARSANYCSEPLITIAIWQLSAGTRNPNGQGELGECYSQLYNGGRWDSYGILVEAVSDTLKALASQNTKIVLGDNHNDTLTIVVISGSALDKSVVTGRITSLNAPAPRILPCRTRLRSGWRCRP